MACAVLAACFPSTEIALQKMVTVNLGLPSRAAPGELIIIDADNAGKVLSLWTNHDAFSRLPDGRAFAVTGLTGKSTFYVYGDVHYERGSFYSFSRLEYFVSEIAIDNPPLQKATALRLPSAVWKKPSAEHEERMKKERQQMMEILSRDSGPMNLECWKVPLRSSVSSYFASPRTLPNGKSYYHTGLDLRAQVGYPVRAVAASTVAFAGEHFVPGRVVVLDHGGGLFSRYMHLDAIEVEIGQKVKAGQIIGRTGATGRVEAPHLHWEVLWKGNYANPQTFLPAWAQICDPKSGV